MTQKNLHMLDATSARKKITRAKSNKRFVATLLDRDHRGHQDAVEQWTRLHEAAFPEPSAVQADRDNDGTISAGRRGAPDDRPLSARAGTRALFADNWLQGTDRNQRPAASPNVLGGPGNVRAPVVNEEADRIRSIIENAPARFDIIENPDADRDFGAWRSLHRLGWRAVRDYQTIIEREAEAQGVDADLVKAIMYVENAQSLDSQVDEGLDLGQSESLLPMNIRPDPWAAIEDPPADLGNPETNIRIAVTLIRRIGHRIEDPTPAKVASIWIFTGRELVNDFGARVQDAYDRRLWELPIAPARGEDPYP